MAKPFISRVKWTHFVPHNPTILDIQSAPSAFSKWCFSTGKRVTFKSEMLGASIELVLTKTYFRSSNWLRMLSSWILCCTLRSINLGSFWTKDNHFSAAWASIFRHLHAENSRKFSWVESNHFAAGALLFANNLQILSTLKKFGSYRSFTLNEITKESQLKKKYSPNTIKPRSDDEYNSNLFLSFPGTAHQLPQNSTENSKNLRSYKFFFQELRKN